MSTMVQTDRSPFTQMRDGLSDVFSPGPFGAVGFGSVVRSGSSIFDADTIFERSLGGAGAGAGAQWITASTTDVLTPNGDELSDSASVNSEGESTECGTPDGDQHIWGVEATGSFATSSAPLRAPLLLPLDVNCKLEPLSDPATATTTAAKKRGKKRLAEEGSNETSVGSCKASRGCSSSGSSSASNSNSDVDDERQVEKLVGLLSNAVFQPGARPKCIEQSVIPAGGVMFKEHPKRRRVHVKPVAGCPTTLMDKWYNTGGIKSASDRWDGATGYGLRKRYGKIVRPGGLPVLRFQEYKLLQRSVSSSGAQQPFLHDVDDDSRTGKWLV
jgi:hypothetical protein